MRLPHKKKQVELPIEKIEGIKPLRILPHVFAFPIDDQKFTSMMNQAIDQLRDDGFMELIGKKYGLYARPSRSSF